MPSLQQLDWFTDIIQRRFPSLEYRFVRNKLNNITDEQYDYLKRLLGDEYRAEFDSELTKLEILSL